MVLVLGSLWFACTRRTGLALALLMLYLGLLDGYLKLASGSSKVTLVHDVLLYALVAGVIARTQVQRRRVRRPPLAGWVLAYAVFVLVQIPNPNAGTLLHSLAGVRPHLEFLPLFFLGYLAVRDVLRLRKFVLLLLVVAAANGIVGFVQFNLTPQQAAAWGPGYAQRINGTGVFYGGGAVFTDTAGVGRIRPFGLGSDIGAGGGFGVIALGGVFALAALGVRWRYRLLAMLCGAGAVTAIVTSQGRGVIVAAITTVIAYGLMTAISQRRLAGIAGLALSGAVAYGVVAAIVAGAGSGAFRYQGLAAAKIIGTTNSAGGRPNQVSAFASNVTHYPFGASLGVAGPASAQSGGSSATRTVNAESEFSFLALETGVPGVFAVVGFTALLLGLGLVRIRREPDPAARLLLAAVISPIAGLLITYYASPSTVTVPYGPYLWFVGGATAYWLIERPREQRRTATAPPRVARRAVNPTLRESERDARCWL